MNKFPHIEEQKQRNEKQLSKAKKLYEIAHKAWRKAWLEKSDKLNQIEYDKLNKLYDVLINAEADISYLNFQKYLLNKD